MDKARLLSMKGIYTAEYSYSAKTGFVGLNEEGTRITGYFEISAPTNNHVVVIGRCACYWKKRSKKMLTMFKIRK